MKKIFVLIITFFALGFYLAHSETADKIDLQLDDQIGIAFLSQNIILVLSDDDATLLALDKDKLTNLNKFYYDDLNVLTIKKTIPKIKNIKPIILEDEYEMDDVNYEIKDGLLYISYKGTNLCIYTGEGYNISSCQFVYFHNTKVSDLTLYDYNEIVLYYYKNPLSNEILEKIYEESIDTYQIRDDELTIIKIGEDDYDFIVINND